jgi:malonyl-CoA O-methyltransferase
MTVLRETLLRVDPLNCQLSFADIHTLGDAMMAAGLEQPVLDVERIDVTYPSAHAMLSEMRNSGLVNVAHGRRRGLLSRARSTRIEEAIKSMEVCGFELELIQGHAWKPLSDNGAGAKKLYPPERYIPIIVDSRI